MNLPKTTAFCSTRDRRCTPPLPPSIPPTSHNTPIGPEPFLEGAAFRISPINDKVEWVP